MTAAWHVTASVDGAPISGLLQVSVYNTNLFSSDTFHLILAGDVSFWSTVSGGTIEIAASSDAGQRLTPMVGTIDTILIDPVQRTVCIEGRDLSASLVDGYRQRDFVNQTASEVVEAIAALHGLAANVTPTTGFVGRYYSDGYTRLSLGPFSNLRSDWDLIVQLARENGFDAFVDGRTLNFAPASLVAAAPVYVGVAAVQTIRIQRNLGIASQPPARIHSWNSRTMTQATGTNSPDDPAAGGQNFLFSGANLTESQAAAMAVQYDNELRRLATQVHIRMPWDPALSPRTLFTLVGAGEPLDALYRIESVERHFNSVSGSVQTVHAVAYNP